MSPTTSKKSIKISAINIPARLTCWAIFRRLVRLETRSFKCNNCRLVAHVAEALSDALVLRAVVSQTQILQVRNVHRLVVEGLLRLGAVLLAQAVGGNQFTANQNQFQNLYILIRFSILCSILGIDIARSPGALIDNSMSPRAIIKFCLIFVVPSDLSSTLSHVELVT